MSDLGLDADKEIKKQGWAVGKTLGQGAFGLVKFVSKNGKDAACKIIAKPTNQKEMDAIEMEYVIMTESVHPCIVKCYEAVQTPGHVFLFLELVAGGELFDYIIEKGSFTEHMAAEVMHKLLGALAYLHGRGIVHRDLKPENVLLGKKNSISDVKLTDFGLSAKMDNQAAKLNDAVGTPGYVAPEILFGKAYDEQVDVWSMGVILYILLCGFPPFFANNENLMYTKIKKGAYQFTSPHWDPISAEAKGFVRQMLIVAPTARSTIGVLLKDKWLSSAPDFDVAKGKKGQTSQYAKQLKETENKLAAQRKMEQGMSLAKAQIRLARVMKKALKRSRARRAAKRAEQAKTALKYSILAVGIVMDLIVHGVLPLAGIDLMPSMYTNATVMLPTDRRGYTAAYRVPAATLAGSYLHMTFGLTRVLAAARPTEVGVWLAAIGTMVVEMAATAHAHITESPHASIVASSTNTVSTALVALLLVAMVINTPPEAQPPKAAPQATPKANGKGGGAAKATKPKAAIKSVGFAS